MRASMKPEMIKTRLRVFLIHGMLLVEIIDRGVNHMRMRHKPWANDFWLNTLILQ